MPLERTKTLRLILIGLLALGISLANLTAVAGTVSGVPIVNVDSPIQNYTYEEREVWLNFTVNRPDSWTEPTIGNPVLVRNLGKITHLTYILDGIRSENFTVNDYDVHTIPLSIKESFDFSFPLNGLSTGEHSIQVIVYGEVYVSGGTYKNPGDSPSPIVTSPVTANSTTINFTVKQSLNSEQTNGTPTDENVKLTIIGCVVIIVALSVLLFLRRHKKPLG